MFFETTGIPVDARGQMNAEVKVIDCKTSSGAEVKVQNAID
ncbi:hypothetical protein [Phocaeicola abscessus]|nr:hypothetical protein [Phocaeicola abscessus]